MLRLDRLLTSDSSIASIIFTILSIFPRHLTRMFILRLFLGDRRCWYFCCPVLWHVLLGDMSVFLVLTCTCLSTRVIHWMDGCLIQNKRISYHGIDKMNVQFSTTSKAYKGFLYHKSLKYTIFILYSFDPSRKTIEPEIPTYSCAWTKQPPLRTIPSYTMKYWKEIVMAVHQHNYSNC